MKIKFKKFKEVYTTYINGETDCKTYYLLYKPVFFGLFKKYMRLLSYTTPTTVRFTTMGGATRFFDLEEVEALVEKMNSSPRDFVVDNILRNRL